ncbi:MAG: hypothetical protein VKL20_00675 [Synechocystis sp.]|nr:hypothetical protein [Synechocystis sp.]
MAYGNRPLNPPSDHRITNIRKLDDLVHWGAIIAGLVVAISTQLLLSAIGAAMGFTTIAGSDTPRSNMGGVVEAIGIWTVISLFISLFLGGGITARTFGSINRKTAALNGVILWAITLTLSSWLLVSGVWGTFGLVASNMGNMASPGQQSQATFPNGVDNIPSDPSLPPTTTQDSMPNLSAQQTQEIAGSVAKANWLFTFGSLLGLAASVIGASVGAHNINTYKRTSHEEYNEEYQP